MSVVALVPTDDGLLKQRVHARLVTQGVDDAPTDADTLRRTLSDLLREEQPLLGAPRFDALLEQLTHEVTGLGPLEPLLADPTVTEVMINGPGRAARPAPPRVPGPRPARAVARRSHRHRGHDQRARPRLRGTCRSARAGH